ncbi:hypothetical protein MSPP1_000086 [Malassezia sp. CBS 17886]|nr:hypothetical protein MSPP1_000086 [Malassezia sp. CBS 17886]
MARRTRGPRGSVARAQPPPTSETSLAMQRLFAQHRPLLEHETLPARFPRLLRADMVLHEVDLDAEASATMNRWRRRARAMDPELFADVVERLARLRVALPAAPRAPTFSPTSASVQAVSNHVDGVEREQDARQEAVANARERGEDVVRAERLGAEAELVVLGEPGGSQKEWGRGVATHLGTQTQPYVPPSAPSAQRTAEDTGSALAAIDAQSTDEDAHLWLSHALVLNRVCSARAWDAVLHNALRAPGEAAVNVPSGATPRTIWTDSVRRKRKKKMNKHKYKKLRKRQRAERQRLKK